MYSRESSLPREDKCTEHGRAPLFLRLLFQRLYEAWLHLTRLIYQFVSLEIMMIMIEIIIITKLEFCAKVNLPKLYQTSISPLSVRTSMIVCPRKSSDSRVSFCMSLALMSSSSSQTLTFIRSHELWHSLLKFQKK